MFDEGNNTITINVDPNRKTGSSLIDEQERGRLYSILTYNGSPGLAQWGYQLPEGNETIETYVNKQLFLSHCLVQLHNNM